MEKASKTLSDLFFSYSLIRYSIRIFLEAISTKNVFLLLHCYCFNLARVNDALLIQRYNKYLS